MEASAQISKEDLEDQVMAGSGSFYAVPQRATCEAVNVKPEL
jgi:hypothetical protein